MNMALLFEVFKGIFLFMSIVIGIFFLKGSYMMSEDLFTNIAKIMMPGYLLISGILIGFLIANIWMLKNNTQDKFEKHKIYTKSFIVGIVIGVAFSIIYIFYA